MSHLNKESVKKLTELSRIACSEEEQEAILQDLEKILNHVDQLKELNTDDVPVCNHVISGMCNVTRPDAVGNTMERKTFLDNSPDHTGGMIRVPPVMSSHNQETEG